MKLDLKKPLLDLDGNIIPLVDQNGRKLADQQLMSKMLAGQLAMAVQGNPIKFFDWAIKLNQEGSIEIDRADLKVLIDFVEQHPNLTILTKAQIMKEIDEVNVIKPMSE